MRWLLLLVLLCGCEREVEPRQRDIVPLDKVPAVVLKSAQGKFPDVKFDTAWKTPSGAFEVRGKTKTGKIHDVQVSEAGEVLEAD